MFRLVIHVEDRRLADVLKLLVGKAEMPEPPQPILSADGAGIDRRSPEAVVAGLPPSFHINEFRDRCEAVGYSRGNAANVLVKAREYKLVTKDKAKGRGYWKRGG